MVCHYGMIVYELKENAGNEHAFQAFEISDVSGNSTNVQTNDFFFSIYLFF